MGVVEPTTAIVSAPQRAFIASCCPRGGRGKGENFLLSFSGGKEEGGGWKERERRKEGGGDKWGLNRN